MFQAILELMDEQGLALENGANAVSPPWTYENIFQSVLLTFQSAGLNSFIPILKSYQEKIFQASSCWLLKAYYLMTGFN